MEQIEKTEKVDNPKPSSGYLLYQDVIGTLCSTDWKWVQQEQVMQGKLIIEIRDRG